eukprot:1790193-Pyramimonas_sp.AAC.1
MPTSAARSANMDTQEIDMPDTHPQMPDWVRLIAPHREHFRDSAFVFQHDGEEHVWQFMYLQQKPHPYLAVCRLYAETHTYRPARVVNARNWSAIGDETAT